MIIVRDILTYASTRKLEWLMAGLMIHLGYILSQPLPLFEIQPSFAVLGQYMSENNWAILFGVFGIIRLIVLILNGTHIKQSAEIRMFLSGCAFLIFSMWVWGIDASGTASTGGATYKWLALGELMNVWQSSSDMHARRSGKNGK